MTASSPTLLAVQHVPWETPHRILDGCDGLEVRTVEPLVGDALLDHADVSGAIFMGGPMNVDDVKRFPALATEREWLVEALRLDMPVLGICLGAQLLARALGAEVRRGGQLEIGFAPVEIHDPSDPIVGTLAPETSVLHWHADVIDLPEGAVHLASSAQTKYQAFRAGNAWGILFHPEADEDMLDVWLSDPEMVAEAQTALGPEAPAELRSQSRAAEADLLARSTPCFQAFIDRVVAYQPV